MQISSCSCQPDPGLRSGVLLRYAVSGVLCALATSAQAQMLMANSHANASHYNYNTIQGATSSSGISGGSIGTGGNNAASFSSYVGGEGQFFAISSATARASYATGSLHASAITDREFGDA